MTYTFYTNMHIKFQEWIDKYVFLEKSDRASKDNTHDADFDGDFPYDLISRPYYVDSIIFNLDQSSSSDFDCE